MEYDTNNIINSSEVRKNFSNLSNKVNKSGYAVIMSYNTPKYIVLTMEYAEKLGVEPENAAHKRQ